MNLEVEVEKSLFLIFPMTQVSILFLSWQHYSVGLEVLVLRGHTESHQILSYCSYLVTLDFFKPVNLKEEMVVAQSVGVSGPALSQKGRIVPT